MSVFFSSSRLLLRLNRKSLTCFSDFVSSPPFHICLFNYVFLFVVVFFRLYICILFIRFFRVFLAFFFAKFVCACSNLFRLFLCSFVRSYVHFLSKQLCQPFYGLILLFCQLFAENEKITRNIYTHILIHTHAHMHTCLYIQKRAIHIR